jgi:hypothetical protein
MMGDPTLLQHDRPHATHIASAGLSRTRLTDPQEPLPHRDTSQEDEPCQTQSPSSAKATSC